MPSDDLRALIAVLFGTHKGALADAARALPVDYRRLRRFLSGELSTPAWVRERLALLQAISVIAPPSAGSSAIDRIRHAECGATLGPHLDELLRRAVAAGWDRDEVRVAVMTWAAMSGVEVIDAKVGTTPGEFEVTVVIPLIAQNIDVPVDATRRRRPEKE